MIEYFKIYIKHLKKLKKNNKMEIENDLTGEPLDEDSFFESMVTGLDTK